MSLFQDKKIILGVCGGVAAYKSAELLRLLTKAGAQVQVIMTPSAEQFVAPMTFQALSGNPVRSNLFDQAAETGMGHIELARWADLILIAPATANTIAKISQGVADNLLTTVCLASAASLIIAPAMNQQMWRSEVNQKNIQHFKGRTAISLIGPARGEQACGDNGPGRMEEPESIMQFCEQQLQQLKEQQSLSGLLKGKKLLVTAGPTIEDIDPVRYISNRSSGKMGYAIARAASEAGAEVTLVSGPVVLDAPEGVNCYKVRSAVQMHEKVFEQLDNMDIFIASAAVADYRPVETKSQKIKKSQDTITIELVKNPDILADVSTHNEKLFTVGFAAETTELEKYALDKLDRKKLDMIAANRVGSDNVGRSMGFDSDTNELVLFCKNTDAGIEQKVLPETTKLQLARELIKEIILQYENSNKKKDWK